MLSNTTTAPQVTGDFVLPHEDVVLFAVIHVANLHGKHPWSIMQGIARRPAFMYWVTGGTSAMHYSTMRQLIAKLVNQYGITFDADGFAIKGHRYIRCRGVAPPAILANPSAL